MKKIYLWVFAILAIAAVLSVSTAGFLRAQSEDEAADDSDNSAVLGKLNEILKNQKEILSGIASIKEELGIIKIRITQQQ